MSHIQRITGFVLLALFLVATSCAKTQDSTQARPKQYKVASVRDLTGSVSPDGRHYAFTDWTTGNLVVKDLKTGEERRLTDKDSWLDANEYALYPRISPDGNQIAYCWNNEEGFCELRLIGLDGSGARVLYRREQTPSIAHDWSPDGKQVLASVGKQMALISVADGSVRILKDFAWSAPLEMRFSSDGRYIAYDMPPREDSADRDIFLLATDGSFDVPLVEGPAYEFVLDWTPDGRWLMFASDRDLAVGFGRHAWFLEIVDGQPQTDPELVKPEIRLVRGLGFGPGGSYFYCCDGFTAAGGASGGIFVASLDPNTGTLGPSTKLGAGIGFRTSAEWSPDGRYLAYARLAWPQPATLKILSVETGEERRLGLTLFRSAQLGLFQPRWSRDGRSLLVVAKVPARTVFGSGDHGTYHIDARSGEVTLVIPDCCVWGVWPSDETVIFTKFTSDEVGGPLSIVVKELDTGRERELYQAASPVNLSHLALSPDGRWLAFVRYNAEEEKTALIVMPIAGGESRTLVELPPPMRDPYSNSPVFALTWTPDSRHIIYAPTTVSAEPDEGLIRQYSGAEEPMLWRVPAEGGKPEELGKLSVGIPYSLSIRPDGLRIAIAAHAPAGTSDADEAIWVLENFLPLPPTER